MKKRKRIFVRPNCDKVWYFHCTVCSKKHYKFGSHTECFRRWCNLCQETFEDAKDMKNHALIYHKHNFCQECNQTFENLKKHKQNFH
jgi:hypothetical protein